jgi:hypothetical protein
MSYVSEFNVPDVGYGVSFDRSDLAKYVKRHRPDVWKKMGEKIGCWIK